MLKDKKYLHLLQKEGVVVIPFLNNEEIVTLKKAYYDIHPDDPPRLMHGMHMTTWCPDLQYKMKVKATLEELLENARERTFENFRFLNHVFIVKMSGEDSTFQIHQDWSMIDEEHYSSVNVWIPLQDVDNNNGALYIVRGSHKINQPLRGAGLLFPDYTPLIPDLKDVMKPVVARAGEAVVFYHRTIHGSPPNISSSPRIVASFTVIPKEAPLCVYFQRSPESPLEAHQPEDDFVFKYGDIQAESVVAPPSSKPSRVFNPYRLNEISAAEILEVVPS